MTTMDGIIKATGGGGRVGIGEDDIGDGMQCSDHPYRNNPGGICAFCLQEKLGKLVSSSFPLPIRGSSSSSSSPSFRSDIAGVVGVSNGAVTTAAGSSSSVASLSSSSVVVRPAPIKSGGGGGRSSSSHPYQDYYTRRARIPFLLAKKKKKITAAASSSSDRDIVFKRSKSTSAPARNHFLDAAAYDGDDFSPRRRGGSGFWSFLYLYSKTSASKKTDRVSSFASANGSVSMPKPSPKERTDIVVVEDDESPNSQTTASASASASSFERKVSRSRSVGCGSRSFSGDFFERISTGFGDCTLRRVESQREGKPKSSSSTATSNMKERVKCGGIFGGFMITSSSSSSSSSSYWVSSSAEDMNAKTSHSHAHSHSHSHAPPVAAAGPLAHGRSRSWGWAFASPMRAFGGKPSKDGKRDMASNKNGTTNLSAIPSLLAVR